MFKKLIYTIGIAGICGLLYSATAIAQKSKNTVRIGYYDPISMVDAVYDPKPETGLTTRVVYDNLVGFDRNTGEFKPLLAKSWKRIDPRTIEFKLRTDIKFHDGSDFDADDVVYTINWLADPKVKFRIKSRYFWISKAVKIDRYTVRVLSKRPQASALMRLALSTNIYPSDVHSKLKVKSTFGRNGIGTGPYKIVSVDPNKGVILEKNPGYKHGGPWKPAGKVNRVHLVPIPETQTQIAQLLIGGLDMMYRVPKDQLADLRKDKRFKATVVNGQLYYYMAIDSIGKSGHPALKDKRVRKALMMAINRDGIRKNLIPGGDKLPSQDAMCYRWQKGCGYSTKPPSYNPEAARRLLVDSGFGKGFDVNITSTLPSVIPEAVAGDLRKIGVKATISRLTFPAYRKKQRSGKIQILVNQWASGGLADVQSTVNFFHGKSPRNYYGDKIISKTLITGEAQFDDKKRREVYKVAFDRNNTEFYMMPITPNPPTFLHDKDLSIVGGETDTFGASIVGLSWK
ncbi:MAG: ABC transporter substrate-binding protein [Pseudomonadota bacterium]|nr:ABC transporter substrate-binding protein [Pseudomonadota bacterium]